MRLIDADELLKAVDKEREYLIARGQTGAEHILVHNFRDLIDNAPTVEERPQGEWIVDEDNGISRFMKCSNCGLDAEWLDGGSQFLSNFCPNCGADMRGGAT